MSTTENPLVSEKLFLFRQLLTMNSGRARHRGENTRIISFIITGIGSGIGEQGKLVTTEPMKLIAAAGFSVWIIQRKLLLQADDMHILMTGRRRIHKSPHLNLAQKKSLPGKAEVAINFLLKEPEGD